MARKKQEALAFSILAGDKDAADTIEFYASRLRQRGDESAAEITMKTAQEFRQYREILLAESNEPENGEPEEEGPREPMKDD